MRIVFVAASLVLCTACVPIEDFSKKLNNSFQEISSKPTDSHQEKKTTRANPTVSEVGLANILPPYDKTKSVNLQYPHVALTILKSPQNWAELGPAKTFDGCWTLKATVWSSAKNSKEIGPFDWCSPDEVKVWPGPMSKGMATPGLTDRLHNNLTGMNRTTGPKPPLSIFPTGRAWTDAIVKNSGVNKGYDNETIYSSTAFGRMFFNLTYVMGANSGADDDDMRVWIVNIPN